MNESKQAFGAAGFICRTIGPHMYCSKLFFSFFFGASVPRIVFLSICCSVGIQLWFAEYMWVPLLSRSNTLSITCIVWYSQNGWGTGQAPVPHPLPAHSYPLPKRSDTTFPPTQYPPTNQSRNASTAMTANHNGFFSYLSFVCLADTFPCLLLLFIIGLFWSTS